MIKRIRKWWMCRKYGICPIHGELRPHGGYNEGRWGICPVCLRENEAKNIHRDVTREKARSEALQRLDRDWRVSTTGRE